jgi:pimeloyl-ACP methyl ester carboxylesterase
VVKLLSDTTGARVVCVNPRGIGASSPVASGQHTYTLEQMVDDIETVRDHLGIDRWIFWGMSGGGWLGQIYAQRYPGALTGLILESICSCFRLRLADPACVLSPFYPSWQLTLAERGWISADSHAEASDANTGEWIEVDGVGSVFRRRNGPALLVSPMQVSLEMRAAMPVLWTADTRARLGDIRTRTLVIAGSEDPIVPVSHARALHVAIPASDFLLVEGGGHVPVTQKRPEVAQAVQSFLEALGH